MWLLLEYGPRDHSYYFLIAKIATLKSRIQEEVRDALLRELHEGKVAPGNIELISRVDDSRIREWLGRQLESPDPQMRAVSRRTEGRRKTLPAGIVATSSSPDRYQEIFSKEVDLTDTRMLLKDLGRDLALEIPAGILDARFLEALSLNRWVVAIIKGKGGKTARIWFRLEDTDVVEVAVTEDKLHPPV
jgi:hypothetical protein